MSWLRITMNFYRLNGMHRLKKFVGLTRNVLLNIIQVREFDQYHSFLIYLAFSSCAYLITLLVLKLTDKIAQRKGSGNFDEELARREFQQMKEAYEVCTKTLGELTT